MTGQNVATSRLRYRKNEVIDKVNQIPMEGAVEQHYNYDGYRGKISSIQLSSTNSCTVSISLATSDLCFYLKVLSLEKQTSQILQFFCCLYLIKFSE